MILGDRKIQCVGGATKRSPYKSMPKKGSITFSDLISPLSFSDIVFSTSSKIILGKKASYFVFVFLYGRFYVLHGFFLNTTFPLFKTINFFHACSKVLVRRCPYPNFAAVLLWYHSLGKWTGVCEAFLRKGLHRPHITLVAFYVNY